MAKDFSASAGDAPPPAGAGRARSRLTRRLADIVCLPSSRVSPQERWMTADVLDELLRAADTSLRSKVAARLSEQAEAPPVLLRRLALDAYEVAEPILQRSQALTDFDMMEIARKGERRHRIALARREQVSETVAAALCASGDPDVLSALMRNQGVRLAPQTVDFLVREAGESEALARLLIKRAELRPAQGFALFWSVTHDLRRLILDRFAASRTILQEAAADVFPLFRAEAEPDPAAAAALAYIDRRQRDRAEAERSPHGSLEGAIEAASGQGATDEMRDAFARLANVQRDLMDRMLDDFGGEPLAVLAKATGLSKEHLRRLIDLGEPQSAAMRWEQAEAIFATLSVDKAQTVLRYWNWVMARVRAE
jgi:uncharacterized protein (DUF2336 family)